MVPVRDAGHDQALEIGEDGFHRFAALRPGGGQGIGQFPRLEWRKHGITLGASKVIGDPIDRAVAMAAKFFGSHWRRFTIPAASIFADASGATFQFRSK